MLIVAVIQSLYTGTIPVILSEMFPTRVRYTALSVSYGFSVAIFGGFAPFAATWLIASSGNPLVAGLSRHGRRRRERDRDLEHARSAATCRWNRAEHADMSERRIGIIINGATGRMGTTQHMAQSAGDRRGGRAAAAQRRPADPRAAAGRARRRAAEGAGRGAWRAALDDESRRGARRPVRDLHGLRRDRRPAGARAARDRGGQAHPHREADRADGRRGDGAGARGARGRA